MENLCTCEEDQLMLFQHTEGQIFDSDVLGGNYSNTVRLSVLGLINVCQAKYAMTQQGRAGTNHLEWMELDCFEDKPNYIGLKC